MYRVGPKVFRTVLSQVPRTRSLTRLFHKKVSKEECIRRQGGKPPDIFCFRDRDEQCCQTSWGGMNIPDEGTPEMEEFQEQMAETIAEMLGKKKK